MRAGHVEDYDMRIAVMAPPWVPVPPPAYGGTEAVIDRLCRGFQKRGHEVLLWTTGDSTCPVQRSWLFPRAEGFRMGSLLVELRHVLHGYERILDHDIVHDHTVLGPVYAERWPDLPVVTTNHGPFNDELNDLYRAVRHRVGLIGISRHQAATAVGVTVDRVIHHGVDPEAFPVGRGDVGYFVFLGRMTPDKGATEAALVARQAGVPLLIAAKMREPAEREYFEQRVRPLLGDSVRYVGEVDTDTKMTLLGGARALLNPIRWPEPFGLVMIEAMACGTPVLAFPEGAAPEIVEHGVTGFLCRDREEMVERIGDVDQLNRAACRAAVEGYFSTDRMVAEHLDFFTSFLEARRGARREEVG
jgi:glycosyltransferase involved in cell wall biosynthesis